MYNKIYDPVQSNYITLDKIDGVNVLMKYLDFLKGGRPKFPNPPKAPSDMKKISPPKTVSIHKKISPKKLLLKKSSPKKESPKKSSPKKSPSPPKKISPKRTSPKKNSPNIRTRRRRKYILGKRISPPKANYDTSDISTGMTRLYRTLMSYRDNPEPIIGQKKTTTKYLKNLITGESTKMKASIKEYFNELDRYTIQYGIAVNSMRTQRKQNVTIPPLDEVNNTFDKIFDSLLKDYTDSLTKIYWINLIFKYQERTPSTNFIVKNAISISKGFRESLVKLDAFKRVRGNMVPHLMRLDFALDELPNFRRLNYLEFGKV